MKFRLVFVCIFTISINILQSQNCIKVLNKEGLPVDLANVKITDQTGNTLGTGVTDTMGGFVFQDFNYEEIFISIYHLSFERINNIKFNKGNDCMEFILRNANFLMEEIWFYSDRKVPQGQLQFRRTDFLQIAGSFDDPSRLLSKTDGVTPVNDQNNAISFQGMPSHYNKWQINGGDVVNPNHLSNAGTSFDIYSPSAGGVNIISGQVIDQFTYKSPVAAGYEAGQVSGTAAVTLADSIDNYAQLSLIGLEGGIHHKAGTVNLMANLRYSFTGLLALMGVDFGGEVINYKDIVVGISDQSKPLKWNTFLVYGDDSNKKGDAIWKSNTFIFSNRLEWNKNNWKIAHITNFSTKRTVLPSALRWPDAKEQLFFHKTSFNHHRFSVDFMIRDQINESIFMISPENQYGIIGLIPGWKSKINENWSYHIELPLLSNYRAQGKIRFAQKGSLDFQNQNISWSTGISSQTIDRGGMILRVGEEPLKSYHISSTLSLEKSSLRPAVALFYNRVNDPEYSFDEVWGDAQANLLPEMFDFMRAKFGTSWGGNFIVKPKISSTSGLQLNTTLFRSLVNNQLNRENATDTESLNPTSNDIRYIINGNLYKYFQLKKGRLFASVGWLFRGKSMRYIYSESSSGAIVPENFGIQTGKSYMRLDTRISYQKKKYILSLDIQNFTNRVNDFSYGITQGWGDQLGLLPNISWKYFL